MNERMNKNILNKFSYFILIYLFIYLLFIEIFPIFISQFLSLNSNKKKLFHSLLELFVFFLFFLFNQYLDRILFYLSIFILFYFIN